MTPPPCDPITALAADRERQRTAWAGSGAMALTGWPGSPSVGPPEGLVPRLRRVAQVLGSRAAQLGDRLDVDPLALLGERAALSRLAAGGDVSCGGATRLLPAGDRWMAVTLARAEDAELLPAWLELGEPSADVWAALAEAVATRPLEPLVERALLLGLPIGVLPSPVQDALPRPDDGHLPIRRRAVPGPRRTGPLSEVVVVDLSALWAGPLCGSLLAQAGATVVKVESTSRPDGARLGPPAFFDLLNAGKRSVALDLRRASGVDALRDLLDAADVVIEASRPRALEHLGIDAAQVLASGGPRVWASITGHGRTGAGRDRVAFGDDAAVAGGLVCWADERPVFCADAIADPTTGLVAAAAILEALATGGHWLLDIAMAEVAAFLAGPTLPVTDPSLPVAAPRARTARGRGPRLGEDTAEVLAGLRR